MLIGAHYYPWYKRQKWKLRTARYYQQQQPNMGWYNNVEDPIIIEKQFSTCKEYGIDFLLISQENQDLLLYLDIAEKTGIKLAAHCETLAKAKSQKVSKDELSKLLFDTPRLADWMKHPAWLKIENKPVIAYYVTRQIQTEILPEAISRMREVFGDCYLLGDEVWWTTPDSNRLELFDAIYSYNMYINIGDKMDRGRVISKGETGSNYIDLIGPYEKNFFEISRQTNTKFFPTVLPGYNDRAVRYDADHYVIPREDGQFFKQYLKHANQLLDDGVLLVTSFNEWYEDTQIESCVSDRVKITDNRDLLQNISEQPYRNLYLEILSDFKASMLNREYLDAAALLYYQTTLIPIVALKEFPVSELQKQYHFATEKAIEHGITVDDIRQRAYCLAEQFLKEKPNV